MSSEIIKVLDELCARFGIAIDWSQENIIPQLETLAQKLVRYECATSKMWLVFGLILIAIGIGLIIMDCHFDADGLMATFGVIAIVIGVVIVMFQITDIIACNTFPEKVVLDYLKVYLKK